MSHMSQRIAGACSAPFQGRSRRTSLPACHYAKGRGRSGVVWTVWCDLETLCVHSTGGGRGRGRVGRRRVGLTPSEAGQSRCQKKLTH
jgi:hypothetical protein